jgi:hypothetical protein
MFSRRRVSTAACQIDHGAVIISMQLEFEVQRMTRRCAATDRALEPGDVCYSVLEARGADLVRTDYCTTAWAGPPEGAIGWWLARIPAATAKTVKLAPNDVLLKLFDQLAEQPESEDIRYVLALLLIRRRVLRMESPSETIGLPSALERNASSLGNCDTLEMMTVYCPKRETSYCLTVAIPSGERIDEIQRLLSEWLISEAN